MSDRAQIILGALIAVSIFALVFLRVATQQ
jgi:hypothetical protein